MIKMVREALSYFNEQIMYKCKPWYVSKQVEYYETINASMLFEPVSAREISAKLRLGIRDNIPIDNHP